MTTDERARRNQEVFSARARGLTWPTIAAQFRLSERQCRRICAEYRVASGSLADLDVEEIVGETIDAYDAAIEELALLSRATGHDGTRLGAIRARLDAVTSKWKLMEAIGALPANLGELWAEFDAQRVAKDICTVLERRDVPSAVQREIVDAVERRRVEA